MSGGAELLEEFFRRARECGCGICNACKAADAMRNSAEHYRPASRFDFDAARRKQVALDGALVILDGVIAALARLSPPALPSLRQVRTLLLEAGAHE